jgi:hypothetical protein
MDNGRHRIAIFAIEKLLKVPFKFKVLNRSSQSLKLKIQQKKRKKGLYHGN